MANEIKLEIEIDIGVTSLGKYTFPIIALFAIKVLDVAFTVAEKYPQQIVPAM